jgi:hypothetical protein
VKTVFLIHQLYIAYNDLLYSNKLYAKIVTLSAITSYPYKSMVRY